MRALALIAAALGFSTVLTGGMPPLAADSPHGYGSRITKLWTVGHRRQDTRRWRRRAPGPQVRGFRFRPGGHRYGYANEPYLYHNKDGYGFYPYFDDRSFWERVQSNSYPSSP